MHKIRKKSIAWFAVGVLAAALGGAYLTRDQTSSRQSLTAVGSTALQPLVEAAGTEYSQQHPDLTINVQGGGTGTGLSQVSQGAVDLGNSDVFAGEKTGIDATKLVDHRVAVVGITPIMHQGTGVNHVTCEQLQAIFTGKYTNWRQLGGRDLPIVVINRAAGSGTRATFEKTALAGQKSIRAQEQDSSGMVRSIVSTTPGAISYVAFAYANGTVTVPTVDGFAPTASNVMTGAYPIWSYEHVYTKGQPQAATADFLAYLTTPDVQNRLVKKLGYISIHDMRVERTIDGRVTPKGTNKG